MSNREQAHTDVIIIGAGLSGIAAAYHLQDKCPGKTYEVLEARSAMGGTWDLFQYPGIRSDSDMYTLGFSFYPWRDPKAIADGPSIKAYIEETAAHFGIDKRIRYQSKVTTAEWNSDAKKWTLGIKNSDGEVQYKSCKFLINCTGYYNYDQGYMPDYQGVEDYRGQLIHPQHWDTSLDYSDKKIVVIGSGATAVTLVPELAKKAKQVTMLQRSPTYIISVPSEDPLVNTARKVLPAKLSYKFGRWKNIRQSIMIYGLSRRFPKSVRRLFQRGVRQSLPDGYDMRHFTPKYEPWDQRLCVVPDGDLFDAISEGRADVATDTIDRFVPEGIRLSSGDVIDADIIVSATGLNIQLFGGITPLMDGVEVTPADHFVYRGAMINDLPNFAFAVGYTNASWTLKCDLTAQYIAKLLNHMSSYCHEVVTPRFDAERYSPERLLDFDAGYVKRMEHMLPRQGSAEPWKVHQNYIKDKKTIGEADMEDGHLEYS